MENILGTTENLTLYNKEGKGIYEFKDSNGYGYEYTYDSNGKELTFKNSDGITRGFDIPEFTMEELVQKLGNFIQKNMKNIHLIPTDKSSGLCINGKNGQNICITSNEEIKANVYCLINGVLCKTELLNDKIVSRQLSGGATMDICKSEYSEIILTTDQDLINDGVQAIDDEFLEWFVKNPSCEEVEVDRIELNTDYRSDWKQKFRYKVIIQKEEQKQETTLEEAAEKESEVQGWGKYESNSEQYAIKQSFIQGAEWQAERMYTEEDLMEAWHNGMKSDNGFFGSFKEWFEQFKKK